MRTIYHDHVAASFNSDSISARTGSKRLLPFGLWLMVAAFACISDEFCVIASNKTSERMAADSVCR